MGKSREFQKNIYFCFTDYAKAFVWKILKEMGVPDHLTRLLRNLYVGQKATVRTRHGTTDWFLILKGVSQGCILSPCLFNFYAEYIMWNARMDDSEAGIKIAGRNINNLRYADDTTCMAESEEDIKSLLMRMKEESEKAGLKLNIKKLRPWHPAPSYHSKQMGEKWKQWDFIFLGFKITVDSDWSHEFTRCLLLGRKALTQSYDSVLKSRDIT